jgi:hypothetical protein
LKIIDKTPDSGDRLTWKWTRGAATNRADFGDPVGGDTSYEVCIYDAGGNTIGRAGAPAGGTCDGRPCWTDNGVRVVYRSRDRRPPGGGPRSAVRLTLIPGAAGQAKILVQGRGSHLALRPLPATQPVIAQIKNSDGVCWEAEYSAPARRNQPGRFQDGAD